MVDQIPLYRFLKSDAALKTLKAGKFRVGLASQFNDPFEWRLGFTGIRTPEEQKYIEDLSMDHRRWLDTWLGILCFSDSFSRPVLWSLYAEEHKGVAFEVICPWKDDEIVKMTYFPERRVLDFDRWREIRFDEEAQNKYLSNLINGLIRNKSPGFSFEQEYRLQINLEDHNRCQYSDGSYFWRLPDKSLKRVILGFCCPLAETDVKKLLDKNGFEETRVVRAKMCQETYSIIV